MGKLTKRAFLATLFAASTGACFLDPFRDKTPEVSFSKFQRDLESGKITHIFVEDQTAWCVTENNDAKVSLPPNFDIAAAVKNKKVELVVAAKKDIVAKTGSAGLDLGKKYGSYGVLAISGIALTMEAFKAWDSHRTFKNYPEDEKKLTAWHEAAHAVATVVMPGVCDLGKTTIIPDGFMVGSVERLTPKHIRNARKSMVENDLVNALSGRAAEKKIFTGDYSTGAIGDLKHAKELAQSMITEFGMSGAMGPVYYGEIFSGLRGLWNRQFITRETLKRIDDEVEKMIRDAEKSADRFVHNYEPTIKLVAEALLREGTLEAEEVFAIVANEHAEVLQFDRHAA